MKPLQLSIKTTSLCNRRCKNCSVISWMDANPNFHTSIKQVENLIKYSKESNYHWEYILLSGGEPLLWKNCLEGTKLLYESGICSRLILLTNGLQIKSETLRFIDKIIRNVHEFRISMYNDNTRNIALAEEYFGKFKNPYGNPTLNVVDRQIHLKPVTWGEAFGDSPTDLLPADCTCKAYSMLGDEVWYCGPMHSIILKESKDFRNLESFMWESYKTKIAYGKHFLNYIKVYEDNFISCEYCISNAKVAKHLKRAEA